MGEASQEDDAPERVWATCPGCWGQRVQWIQTDEGWWSRPCPSCLGLGETIRDAA